MEYDSSIFSPKDLEELKRCSPINSFNTRYYFDPHKKEITNVFKSSIFKNARQSACFQFLRYDPLKDHSGKRQVKEGNVYLYFRLISKDYVKYLKLIQEVVNKIAPCKYFRHKNSNLICFMYELQDNYYANLFIGDIIRPLWFYVSLYFDDEGSIKFYQELEKYTTDNSNYDPIVAVCESIKSSVTKSTKNVYWGDHCFFTKGVVTKTLDNFNDTYRRPNSKPIPVQSFLKTE